MVTLMDKKYEGANAVLIKLGHFPHLTFVEDGRRAGASVRDDWAGNVASARMQTISRCQATAYRNPLILLFCRI